MNMKRNPSVLLSAILAAALLFTACGSKPAGVQAEDNLEMVKAFLNTDGDLAYCGPKVTQEDASRLVKAVQDVEAEGGSIFLTYGEPIGLYRMKQGEENALIATVTTKEGKDKGAYYIEEIIFPD